MDLFIPQKHRKCAITCDFSNEIITECQEIKYFCREALDKIESLVKEMVQSEHHSAAISMGDVTGVIQIQADNAETKDFCYSSDQNALNVRPEKHNSY